MVLPDREPVGVSGMFAIVLAVAVTAVGLSIVFGPWVYRMTNQLGHERRERIRSEERTELAAHLHDSVLQTLALIQRNATQPAQDGEPRAASGARAPRVAVRLARDRRRALRDASTQLLEEIEDAYDVTIETVMVGDCAARRADGGRPRSRCSRPRRTRRVTPGTTEISVYIECEPRSITAYVRDRGNGLRSGLRPGRTAAASPTRSADASSGTAARSTITSAPGEGCEVQITMPLNGADAMTRVFIVDDHQLFLAGVRAELAGRVELVGEAYEVDTAIQRHPRGEAGRRPASTSTCRAAAGKAVIEAVKETHPDVKFLALSVSDAAEDVIALVRAGARGYVTKTIAPDELVDVDHAHRRRRRVVLAAARRVRPRRVRRRDRGARPIRRSISSPSARRRCCG